MSYLSSSETYTKSNIKRGFWVLVYYEFLIFFLNMIMTSLFWSYLLIWGFHFSGAEIAGWLLVFIFLVKFGSFCKSNSSRCQFWFRCTYLIMNLLLWFLCWNVFFWEFCKCIQGLRWGNRKKKMISMVMSLCHLWRLLNPFP